MFFLKADKENGRRMKEILDDYLKALGQLANLNKLCIFFSSNTPTEVRDNISNILGTSRMDCPGKYLGIPVI